MYNYDNNLPQNNNNKMDAPNSVPIKKTKKQVRFNKNVNFKSYVDSPTNEMIDVDKSIMNKKSSSNTINVDRIVGTIDPHDRIVGIIDPHDETITEHEHQGKPGYHDEIVGTTDSNEKLLCGVDLDDFSIPLGDPTERIDDKKSKHNKDKTTKDKAKNKVHAVNEEDKDSAEKVWYDSFSTPLMDPDDKKKFYAKIQKSYKDYEKSFGEFIQYQMDNDTLIKTDITIDRFKPEKRNNNCGGKAIKDIYDEMVAPPKAKPKKIKRKTDRCIIYDDESELNGGNIRGTTMCGFDGNNDGFKSAAFGNEF